MDESKLRTCGSLFSGGGFFDEAFSRAGFDLRWQVEIDKDARDVSTRHFPDVLKYEDVRLVGAHNLEPVDVIFGGFPCFPEGTLVLCRDGQKDIKNVEIGDEVLTHNGRWRRVEAVMGRWSETVILKGAGHSNMTTTPDHPFFSASYVTAMQPAAEARAQGREHRRTIRRFGTPKWTPASGMRGRYWATPISYPSLPIPDFQVKGRQHRPCEMAGDFYWLAGAWLGNGWADTSPRLDRPDGAMKGRVVVCIGHDRADELDERIRSAGLRATRSVERTATKFIISSEPLALWLQSNFGKYAHGKKLPSWLLGADRSIRQSVFDGYIWTDGWVNGDTRKASTVSKELAIGLKALATSLGLGVTMHFQESRGECVIEGRVVNQRASWMLVFQLASNTQSVVIGSYRFGLVRSVAETKEMHYVYDISVEEDHSFIADGIVVHNCQDLSNAGKRRGLEGERSGLFFEFVRIVSELEPSLVVIENVPGLISNHGGDDFRVVLRSLLDIGARDICWRILDAEYYGVPQRRRRVFIVADFGDGSRAGEVLFESPRVSGHFEPRKEARKRLAVAGGDGAAASRGGDGGGGVEVAAPITTGSSATAGVSRPSRRMEDDFNLAVEGGPLAGDDAIGPLQSRSGGDRQDADSAGAGLYIPVLEAGARMGTKSDKRDGLGIGEDGDPMYTLQASHQHAILYAEDVAGTITNRYMKVVNTTVDDGAVVVETDPFVFESRVARNGRGAPEDVCPPLKAQSGLTGKGDSAPLVVANEHAPVAMSENQRAEINLSEVTQSLTHGGGKPGQGYPAVIQRLRIRRLTPKECERLQGAPDDFTSHGASGKAMSDSARYRITGNAGAIPVMEWIASRLLAVL